MGDGKSTPGLGKLLADRRFGPLFWTQALGAFNDNAFKNAIVILITYRSATLLGLSSEKLVALCGGIFILPFFLFSATAGELADQRSKSNLSAVTKLWELGVVSVGAIGFFFGSLPFLLASLFMLGVQATFFGPIKYGILPELLGPKELVSGNALIELGTFIAILLGTLFGGLLMGAGSAGPKLVSALSVGVAILGYLASRRIRPVPAQSPGLRVSLNPFAPTLELFRIARKVRSVFLSLLAISWFWLLGSVVLSVLPPLAKDALGASESVLTFFLAVFSVGIGLGSILCERLSFRTLELGLVPIGSVGMSLFSLDLGLMTMPSAPTIASLFASAGGLRLVADLLLFSASAGLFTVPLYTLIQLRSDEKERSRVIAANNVLNALFMIAGAIGLTGLYSLGVRATQVFLVLALANALVASYVYAVLPEFFFRFVAWLLSRGMYRLRVEGIENLPETGPALIVCNHVSFVDWLLISSACPRPIRFVMHSAFMRIPVLGLFFRRAKVIPIAGRSEDSRTLREAFETISRELRAGELVCIFPEGEITRTGEMAPFKRGVERILERDPVPTVPMALGGMWGSFFSRYYGRAMSKPFRRFFARVDLRIGSALAPDEASAPVLEARVASLLTSAERR